MNKILYFKCNSRSAVSCLIFGLRTLEYNEKFTFVSLLDGIVTQIKDF